MTFSTWSFSFVLMEHTEEPSYLDLLPAELREQVVTNLLPVIPEVPSGLSLRDFELGTIRAASDYQHMINDTLNEYFRPSDVAAAIPYAPGEEGKEVRRTMERYFWARDRHLKLAEEIRTIPIVKHILKRRNRSRVLKR